MITSTVTFTWKNYPYLTVTTLLDKTSAKVGDLLHVTITVTGNGAALQPKPIDVVLSMDRSGSMLEGYPDNMVTAKSAASAFASCLTYGRDNIGIVSFGDNSATNGWVNLSPTMVHDLVAQNQSWNWSNVYSFETGNQVNSNHNSWAWVAVDTATSAAAGWEPKRFRVLVRSNRCTPDST